MPDLEARPVIHSPPQQGSRRLPPFASIALALLAAGLVASSVFLPVWRAELIAPQYPGGLHLIAYGHTVAGDVHEIGMLNHYVGMRAFDPADAPEMALWPFAVAGALMAVAVAMLSRRRLLSNAAKGYLWLMPVGVLADIQFRLYQYGHDIEETAAFRIPEFTPWVVGPTEVLNFTTWARPGAGVLALFAAAAVVTFGPRLARLIQRRRKGLAVTSLTAVLAVGLFATPGAAEDHRDLAAMLADLPPGATVRLPPGTYHGNVVIDTPVHLVGVDRPSIVGDGTGSTITIRAPGTVLTGVDVRGSGPGPIGDPAGIRVEADDVRIEDVTVADAYIGIAVSGAERIRLEGNTILGRQDAAILGEDHVLGHDAAEASRQAARGDGVWLWNVDGALLRNNHISHVRDGIFVSHGAHALIDGNHVEDSRFAVHSMFARDLTLAENTLRANLSGAVLMHGGPLLLLRNTVTDNRSTASGVGVLIKDVGSAELVQNVVARNRVGLDLETVGGAPAPTAQGDHAVHSASDDGGAAGGNVVRVHANTVALNRTGVALAPSTPGRFSANSFVDNTIQVLPNGGGRIRSEWTENGWGNHWSTYRGDEASVPGRGAVPHTEGSRPVVVDELPLTVSHSPPVPADPADPLADRALWGAGLVLVAAAGLALQHVRRPSRTSRPAPAQRDLRP